jgi:hypothetical protein
MNRLTAAKERVVTPLSAGGGLLCMMIAAHNTRHLACSIAKLKKLQLDDL